MGSIHFYSDHGGLAGVSSHIFGYLCGYPMIKTSSEVRMSCSTAGFD